MTPVAEAPRRRTGRPVRGNSHWYCRRGSGIRPGWHPSDIQQSGRSPANAAAFEADWSPDGRQLVFKWFEQGWDHNELRVADVDGSNMRTVWTGQSGETAETPDWGP